MKNQFIFFNSLNDEQMVEFERHPYNFYEQMAFQKPDSLHLNQSLQFVVNEIIYNYYRLPINSRSLCKLLTLVDKYWSQLDKGSFNSNFHYYSLLASVTDHLMKFLQSEQGEIPLLFLYEKKSVFINELNLNLTMKFEVTECTEDSFIVKKYLIDDDMCSIQAFKNMMVVFFVKAFNILPEKLEVYILTSGRKYEFYPSSLDYEKALLYLKLMKDFLKDSRDYLDPGSFLDCKTCPIKVKCTKTRKTNLKKSLLYM